MKAARSDPTASSCVPGCTWQGPLKVYIRFGIFSLSLFTRRCVSLCVLMYDSQKLSDHLKSECEFKMGPCYFADIGCDEAGPHMLSHEIKEHEQDHVTSHMHLLKDYMTQLQQQVTTLTQQVQDLQTKLQSSTHKPQVKEQKEKEKRDQHEDEEKKKGDVDMDTDMDMEHAMPEKKGNDNGDNRGGIFGELIRTSIPTEREAKAYSNVERMRDATQQCIQKYNDDMDRMTISRLVTHSFHCVCVVCTRNKIIITSRLYVC